MLGFSGGAMQVCLFDHSCAGCAPARQELFEERWAASGLEPKVEQQPKAKQSEEKAAPSGERGALVILGKFFF